MSALPDDLVAMLKAPNPCFIATIQPDGSPQVTQTWVDTDGELVLINSPEGTQKVRNVARDARVSINVCDRDAFHRYWHLRGHVESTTTDGAQEHIEELSQRYTGGPYQNYGNRSDGRVIMRVAVDKIVQSPAGWD